MSSDRTIPYRRDIDGLRALAVLLVMVFHFQLSPFGEGGFLGVDVFFVISGFLITAIIVKQLDEAVFGFKRFYLKRILRLAPVLFVVLLLVMVAGTFIYLPSDFKELSRQAIATQLYYSNIYFWQNINYFGLHSDSVPLLHTWSLAVEEQFYLFFPIFLYAVHRVARRHLWLIIFGAAVFSFLLNIAFVDKKPELTFYLMPTRSWEFLLGSIAVLLTATLRGVSRKACEVTSILGIGLIFASVFMYTKDIVFPGYYALLPCVGAVLIILGGSHQRTVVSRLLGSGAMVYIGRLSYSLYLAHWPIHIFAVELLGDEYDLSWRIGMLLLTFLVSILLLHCVEDPVRRGGVFRNERLAYGSYFTGMVASVLVFSSVIAADGFPSRFSDAAVKMASFVEDKPPPMSQCQFKDKPRYEASDFCLIGDKTAPPTWVVFGDSHAWAAEEAFGKWLQAKSESGLFLFRHACPPLMGISLYKAKGECSLFNENVFEFIGRSPDLAHVVLVSTWIYGKTGVITTHSDIMLSKDRASNLFRSSFSDTLSYLNESGKKVYLWGPVPGAKANVPESLARAIDRTKTSEELAYTLDEHLQNHSYFYDVLEDNRAKVHQLFSPATALCLDSGKCKVLIGDNPVYFDGSHIAFSLSDYWAGVLRAQEHNPPTLDSLRSGIRPKF